MKRERIAAVRASVVGGGGADYHDQGEGHWIDGQISCAHSDTPAHGRHP